MTPVLSDLTIGEYDAEVYFEPVKKMTLCSPIARNKLCIQCSFLTIASFIPLQMSQGNGRNFIAIEGLRDERCQVLLL